MIEFPCNCKSVVNCEAKLTLEIYDSLIIFEVTQFHSRSRVVLNQDQARDLINNLKALSHGRWLPL